MILRNFSEVKNINKELSLINKLLWEMRKDTVTLSDLVLIKPKMEALLGCVTTRMDRIDKVWVNRRKMEDIYVEFSKLARSYNEAKLKNAMEGRVLDYDSTDDKWKGSEDRVIDLVSYLNNPDNSRTKDRIHYVATGAVCVVLMASLIAGGAIAMDKYREAQKNYTDTYAIVITLENEKSALEKKISDLNAQIEVLEQQLAEVKNPEEVKKLQEQLDAANIKLAEYETLQQRYDELLIKYEGATKEIESLKDQLSKASSPEEKKQLEDRIAALEAGNKELNDKMLLMISRTEYDALKKTYDELKAKYDALDKNYDGVLAENAILTGENKELTEDVDSKSATISELNSEIASLESTISSLRSKLSAAYSKIADLEKQLEESDSQAKITQLEKERDEAIAKAAALEDELDKVTANFNAYVIEMNSKYSALEALYEDVLEENTALKAQLAEQEEQLKAHEELIDNIDAYYKQTFGNDGAGLTSSEKFVRIVEYRAMSNGTYTKDKLITILINVQKKYSEEELKAMSETELVDMVSDIFGEIIEPSEGPADDGPVYEETATPPEPPTTPTTPEAGNSGDSQEEISPDHGFVNG